MPVPSLRHAVFLAAFLSPAIAAAQKPPPASAPQEDRQTAARGLAQEGLKLYGADRWAEALASFREADRLFHAPSVTLYIARTQRKMGKLLDARATYEQLLSESLPKDASPQFVQAHVEAGQELEALKPRVPTLRVVVSGVAPGSVVVTLDGTPCDGSREVDPGAHMVEVRPRAPGPVAPIARTVAVAEGTHDTLPIDLGAPATPVTPSGRWYLPGSVALGVGVLGLGAGAITGALSLSKTSQIKSQCKGDNCPSSLEGQRNTAVLLGNLSTATFVVGGVGAVAGGVLLYLNRPRRSGPEHQGGLRAHVGLGHVDVEGSF